MAGGGELTITGDAELVRQLAAIADAASGRMLHRAAVAGGQLIANDAKIHAPYRRGNYRRSIHVGGEGVEGDTTGTDIGGAEIGTASATVKIGSNVEYGPFLELGTRHMPARPHLRPALESQRDAVKAEVGAAIKDQIRAAIR